jgi:hypothetical protein
MNSTGFSFFNHEDFDFGHDEEDEIKKKQALLESNIRIVILNKQVYRGGRLCGIVKIHAVNELPEGHIEIKCESSLKLKIRKEFEPLKFGKVIKDYKKGIEQVELRNPKIIFSNGKKVSKNKVVPAQEETATSGGEIPLKKFKTYTRGNNFIQRIKKMKKKKQKNNINFLTPNPKPKKMMNNQNFKKLAAMMHKKSEKVVRIKEEELQEKSYVLKSQVMTLFTLRNDIDIETILIVPFQIDIPENFPISYKQCLLLSQVLNLKMKRDCLLKNKDFFNVNLFGSHGLDFSKEEVSIEHKLIAYYVSKQSHHNPEKRLDVDSQLGHSVDRGITKIFSEEKFEVYHRMREIDFMKAVSKGTIKSNKDGKEGCCMMRLMKREINYDVKISLDRMTFRNRDSAINIVIDYPNKLLTLYDYIDVVLVSRCKIKSITYEEDIRNKMKDGLGKMIGIDVMKLKKQRQRAKDMRSYSKDSGKVAGQKRRISFIPLYSNAGRARKLSSFQRKNSKAGIKDVVKISEKPEIEQKKRKKEAEDWPRLLKIDTMTEKSKVTEETGKTKKKNLGVPDDGYNEKPMPIRIDEEVEEDKTIKVSELQEKPSISMRSFSKFSKTSSKREREEEEAEDAEGFKSIERIVYATSLDLIGKRKLNIDLDEELEESNCERTELVHRINISDIKIGLETVQTEYMSLDYKLMFFASVGPLGFKKKIQELPLTFVALPKDFGLININISKAWKEIHGKISKFDYAFMLPHAKLQVR